MGRIWAAVALLGALLAGCVPAATDRAESSSVPAGEHYFPGYLFSQDEVEGFCQRYFGLPAQWVRESGRYLPERESYALIYRPVPREYLFALDDWQVGGSLMSLSVSVYEQTADGERGALLRRRRISIEGTGDGGFHYVGVITLPTQ